MAPWKHVLFGKAMEPAYFRYLEFHKIPLLEIRIEHMFFQKILDLNKQVVGGQAMLDTS